MIFTKFLTQSVHLGGIRGHNPLKGRVLQHFQEVLSLNITVPTEFDLGRTFDSISLKLDRTVVSIEDWSFIVFGPIWPNEGALEVTLIQEFFDFQLCFIFSFSFIELHLS